MLLSYLAHMSHCLILHGFNAYSLPFYIYSLDQGFKFVLLQLCFHMGRLNGDLLLEQRCCRIFELYNSNGSTYKLNKQECMANRDLLHQLQWALKTYFCPWETKKSVSFCTKILDFFSAFQLHLKYLGLGLVEKMSIALPICRECGAAV